MQWNIKPSTLFFDYDGTLHQCLNIYAPAFRQTYRELVLKGYAAPRSFTDSEISQWLGQPAADMWNSFMPWLPEKIRDDASRQIGHTMVSMTLNGKAALYPHVTDTLNCLKKAGYHLIFLSNCKHSYMMAHRKAFCLDNYFSGFHCIEDYGFSSKWEIYHQIRNQYPLSHVIIGDRNSDFEIGTRFGLPSIGCTYGYGTEEEYKNASIKIHCISQLKELLL